MRLLLFANITNNTFYFAINIMFAKLQIGNINKWRPIFLGYFWPKYLRDVLHHHVLCLFISHFETISALWCYLWMFPRLTTSWNLLRTFLKLRFVADHVLNKCAKVNFTHKVHIKYRHVFLDFLINYYALCKGKKDEFYVHRQFNLHPDI